MQTTKAKTTFEKLKALRRDLAYVAACEGRVQPINYPCQFAEVKARPTPFENKSREIHETYIEKEGYVDIHDLTSSEMEWLDFMYWEAQGVWLPPLWVMPFLPEYIHGVSLSVDDGEIVREECEMSSQDIFCNYVRDNTLFGIVAKDQKK